MKGFWYKFRISRYDIICLSLTLYGLFLRFLALAKRDLWGDEIFQIHNTLGSFKPFWQRLAYGDMTSFPGEYLLTYPFVCLFNDNKWPLAIPHIMATLIGFYFLYVISRRYFKTAIGYLVTFGIMALHVGLIFHSFEFRPYAVLPTLMLVSFYTADRLFNEFGSLAPKTKLGIAVFYIVTVGYHAFGILITTLPIIYFYLSQKWDSFFRIDKRFLTFLSCILVIALPVWIWYSLGPQGGETTAMRVAAGKHPFEFSPNPLDGFLSFFNRIVLYNLIGYKRLNFLLGIFVISLFVPYAAKLKRLGFFLTLILLPIEIILVASIMNSYWFLFRQYIFVVPLFAFFLGWLWDSSVHYYIKYFRQSNREKLSARSIIGLVLMCGCMLGGLIGWLGHILKG